MLRVSFVILIIIACICGYAYADDWRWPGQITMAGMNVSQIQGSVNSDGSGKATGVLQVPGLSSSPNVALERSKKGDIAGKGSINGRMQGVDLQGSFTLSENKLSGDGRASIGSMNANVKYSSDDGALVFRGESPSQCQADTTMATYNFSGTVSVDGGASKLRLLAKGQVQRVGKLANQTTTQSVSDIPVNASDGKGNVNVGGVNVQFKFF